MPIIELSGDDLHRVCRDLAWSEISTMAGFKTSLPQRIDSAQLQWFGDAPGALTLDSLARMQLATAAATWCNAYDIGYEDLFLAKRGVAQWAEVMQRARASGAKHFTFSTSGSTGQRKHIRHFEEVLTSEAQAWASVLRSMPNAIAVRRVVALCPTHHIYGFIWGVLLPIALGVPVIDADVGSMPALLPGDLIVAVPEQWAWLAQSQVRVQGLQGISSTAPLPEGVHRQLLGPPAGQRTGFLARLLQIYGSSETAGLAWRDDPDHAYRLAPERSRGAGDAITLQLANGAHVAMAVQDELHWVSVDSFNLIRRHDQMVQVGGHNVSPDWVASRLQSHPAVQQAAVRLDNRGQRLKAYVVLSNADRLADQRLVEAWALAELPGYACPLQFTYGTQLPTNSIGKLSDWPEA